MTRIWFSIQRVIKEIEVSQVNNLVEWIECCSGKENKQIAVEKYD